MKDKYKVIELEDTGDIECDTDGCEFKFTQVTSDKLKEFIGHPCPDCGENLLTLEDYTHHKNLRNVIRVINWLCFPLTFLTRRKKVEDCSTVNYHHHAGKTTINDESRV